jgi:hypothetical protein
MRTTIKQNIEAIAQRWVEKTKVDFYKRFIDTFPRQRDYNRELRDRDMYGDNWYPEGEVWLLNSVFRVDIEKEGSGVNTEDWCDFFNELCENKW